jgi:hypothetical protein
MSDSARSEVIQEATDTKLVQEAKTITVELSRFSYHSKKLEEVCKSLEQAPPVPFDVSRQVQVFDPYIQYVDLKLQGNHSVSLLPHRKPRKRHKEKIISTITFINR